MPEAKLTPGEYIIPGPGANRLASAYMIFTPKNVPSDVPRVVPQGGAMSAPVERKVKTATAASVLTVFVMGWILKEAPVLSTWAGPLQDLIDGLITGAITFVVAWLTAHTPRPSSNDQTPRPYRM